MPDDNDERSSRRIATPQGMRIQTEERRRGEHRDHAVNRQPISRPDYDAIPEDVDWEKTPVHMSPLDAANFRAKRASNHSHMTRDIALSKVTQVRLELKADVEKVSGKVDALDGKFDELSKKVSAQDAKLDVMTTMLKDELDAKRHERGVQFNVGAQDALSQIKEREATGAVRRDLSTRAMLVLLGVVGTVATALTTYLLATR